MPRTERVITLPVDPGSTGKLVSTGGRFQWGLYLRVRGPRADQVIAWLPTGGGRSVKSPPRFVGSVDGVGTPTAVRGVITESWFEVWQGWLWAALAALCLVIAIGAAVSSVNGGGTSAILGVVAFALFGLCFAALARWLPKGHVEAFEKDADALEAAMNGWIAGAEHRNRA